MKAIIIEDKDARALVDQLKLTELQGRPIGHNAGVIAERRGITADEMRLLFEEIHGVFHYRVVVWLQEQGADVVRR